MIQKYETYKIDIQASDVYVEYANCGSHELHLHVTIEGGRLEKLKAEIEQAERAKEIELVEEAAKREMAKLNITRTKVVVTDEETMGEPE